MELLGHVLILCLLCGGITVLFSTVAAPLSILTGSAHALQFSHRFPKTCYVLLFQSWPSERVCSGMCLWFGVAFMETEGSTVVILGQRAANGESVFHGARVSVGEDEKVPATEGGNG